MIVVFDNDSGELPDETSDSFSLPDVSPDELPEFPELPDAENLEALIQEAIEDSEVEDDLFSSSLDDLIKMRDSSDNSYDENDSFGGVSDEVKEPREVLSKSFGAFAVEDDEDPLLGFNIDKVLSDAIDLGASDVHINPNDQVSFTILGDIYRQPGYVELTGNITQRLQQKIISHVLEADFVEELELDTSYVIKTGKHRGRRMRLSVGKSFGEIFMVFRVIADKVPTPEELGISGELLSWTELPNGLIMVNGPTGTGKSTTLASMLKKIQLERAQKVITIERPIEFVFGNEGKALVTQREVGKDARSFSNALTSAMRQAPDIIMVGEVRNRVEVNELLRAAETGHLAISTMHTNSAPATINRIKSLYEGDEQLRILSGLSDVARGFANQVLLKTVDGKGRFAVREVLPVTREIQDLILKGDVRGIREYQIDNKITMEHELVKAVRSGKVDVRTARGQSAYPHYFDELMNSRF